MIALVLLFARPDALYAESDVEDVFEGFGTAERAGEAPTGREAGQGTIVGRVFDGQSGEAIGDVTVVVTGAASDDGGEPPKYVEVTAADGSFEFPAVTPGRYSVNFIKSGYRASTMTNFEVGPDDTSRADFALPALPTDSVDQVMTLDEFVVEASVAEDMVASLELRMDSDQLLNIMSAEDLSKFAATDVADALKRVSGVNIVEGQFAIIRGLEDRYSSILYNGAPSPSPDPDRQSVQLDLFPSDVVGNLVVAKTFAPELPGNSSGGSIDIDTYDYPDELQLRLNTGGGWETRAVDRFLMYQHDDPIGKELGPWDVIESDLGGSVGGRTELLDREIRFKGVFNREIDYKTAQGYQEERQPDRSRSRRANVLESGDLSLGILSLSRGKFDLTDSRKSRQLTGFGALGIDLDEAGQHKIDGSIFYTKKEDYTVELREDGYLPAFDYTPLLDAVRGGGDVYGFEPGVQFLEFITQRSPLADFRDEDTGAEDGQVFYAPLSESRSFSRVRDLTIYQLNGEHEFGFLDGFRADWAGNYAETNQDETSFATEYFFEPDDPQGQVPLAVPATPDDIGPGRYAADNDISYNANTIHETQYFGRLDLEHMFPVTDFAEFTVRTGGWYEHAKLEVEARYLTSPRLRGDAGNDFAIFGDSPADLGAKIFDALALGDPNSGSAIADTTNESSRKIRAWHGGGTLSLWDTLDLYGGIRIEDIFIESLNDPYLGSNNPFDGSPITFPSRYLFFDRLDNRSLVFESVAPAPGSRGPDFSFNDEILGIEVPIDPVTGFVDLPTAEDLDPLINGEIKTLKYLPGAGITLRPHFHRFLEGLTLRAAYSQTVARPSFREMGFYVTTEPGTDDQVVGNPQLQLSEVESWDFRAEYLFGELGDLFALSLFKKRIDNPIEVIVVRDPTDFTANSSASTFRTFFNNPATADLRGFEVEGRLHLDLMGLTGRAAPFLENFSIGGNYTYIDAEIERSEAERVRSLSFFGLTNADLAREKFSELAKTRRLFSQPEWIANADISFDHPEWGTRVTLAFFAISDVLDAAGAVSLQPDGTPTEFVLDRYSDSFYQLDLIASQEFELPNEWGVLKLNASVKNLTDSSRGIVYDRDQTGKKIDERRFKVGQDVSISLTYTLLF